METEPSHIRIAQESVRGSVILFVGSLAQALASAVAVIIVARVLGPDLYGLYTLSFVIPNLLQLFLGLGVNTAVTRYAAYYVSIGNVGEAKRFTRNGITFIILFGLALTVINYSAAGALSLFVLRRPGMANLVQLSSIIIVSQAILQCAFSGLTGWNSMRLASASNALQGVLKAGLSVGLVLLGFGVSGAITGNVLSYLLAGLVFMLALYVAKLGGSRSSVSDFLRDVKLMIGYAMPAFAGIFVSGLATSYVTIILASIASNAVVGFYQSAYTITIPIALVSSSILSSLLPAFASLDGAGGDIGGALNHAVKYVSYLVTPIVVFLIPAAAVLFDLLYGRAYSSGVFYLQLMSIANLPIALGLTVTPVFFNGVRKTRLTMITYTIDAILLLILAPLLGVVLGFGVAGLIYATAVAAGAAAIVALLLAKRIVGAKVEFGSLFGVLAAAVAGFIAAYPTNFLVLPDIASLLIQLGLFAVVYLTTAPFLRAVKLDDIVRLETATAGLGLLGKMIRPFFEYERYLISAFD